VAELVDVVLHAPQLAGLAHQAGADLGGDDLVGQAVAGGQGRPSKSHTIASPIELNTPSLPHMQTLAVYIRLQKALAWLVICQAWRMGLV
jgi:hypothetical protein